MSTSDRQTGKLAIFDLDGTIVEFILDWRSAREDVCKYLESIGIPGEILDVKNSILDLLAGARHHATKMGIASFDWEEVGEKVSLIVERYEKKAADDARTINGIDEALRELEENNVTMAVCTLNTTWTARKVLSKLGLVRYFKLVVGRDLVKGHPKPDPRHGQYILDRLGFQGKDACMVGDHPADMEMAQALGMKGVAISSKRHDAGEFSVFRDVVVVSDENYGILARRVLEQLGLVNP